MLLLFMATHSCTATSEDIIRLRVRISDHIDYQIYMSFLKFKLILSKLGSIFPYLPNLFCLWSRTDPRPAITLFILIAFYLNCLPDNLVGCITKSTRFDWAHRNFQDSFGFNWYLENKDMFPTLQLVSQHKHLLKINRAFLRV